MNTKYEIRVISQLCPNVSSFFEHSYFFLFAFPAHWALQYLFLLSNVVKTFPQIEHFFWMIPIQWTSSLQLRFNKYKVELCAGIKPPPKKKKAVAGGKQYP